MKKTWKTLGAVSCAALLALTLAACGKDASQAEFIGLDAAKSIALENAGVTQAEAQFSTTGLDRRDGTDFYAVDFTANGQSYEYDIDAITGAIITGPAAAAPSSAAPEASPSPSVGPEGVTADQAKEIALNHAGLTADQVTFIRAQLDRDDGRQVYDVEFYDGSYTEYDYEIEVSTGTILSYDHDADHYNPPAANTGSGTTTSITADKAKEIALNHAGLTAGQVTFVRAQLDWDDGRQVYDVEFYDSDHTEYDYEIDASSGAVLSYDFDAEGYDRPNPGTTTISADQAKEIALARVPGATVNDIYEFELDRDDGRLEYEGTIYYNGMEYDFTIDGYSGAIREWDAEPIWD